jgi:putative ABC transport system permease protein
LASASRSAPTRSKVLGMVLTDTAQLVILGVALGLALAFVTTQLVASFLYGVTATDPATFAFSAATFVAVALAAAFVPARRAARLDPVAALRED